jgi:hypothetical protein
MAPSKSLTAGFLKQKTLITTLIIVMVIVLVVAAVAVTLKYINVGAAAVAASSGKEHLEPRYIICIPQGGIVDMCCVVLSCIKHAQEYNRVLIIDSVNTWFNDDLNEYINIHNPYVLTHAADTITHNINALTTYPPNVDVEKLDTVINTKKDGKPLYTINGTSLMTPLNQDYDAGIVIYSSQRLTGNLPELLEMCTIRPKVLDVYKSRRAQLPKKYVSVHIRNTDYNSDVSKFIEENNHALEHNTIFLASDNKNTIDEMKTKYGSNIVTFAYIPDNGGKPIHDGYKRTKEESRKYNIDTFVDILLLAAADEYYFSCKNSGFSNAVADLRAKPELLKRLLE